MRGILTLLCGLALGGCTQQATPDLRSQITPRLLASTTQPLLLVEAEMIQTAATLVQVSNRDGTVDWRTGDNVSLTFRQGVVIGTRGLGDDLMTADVDGTVLMLAGRQAVEDYNRFASRLDGEYQTQFESFLCRNTGREPVAFDSFGRTRQTTRITELCRNPDRSFENTYWVGSDGTMWKSRQWISPNVGYLTTERLVR